VIASAVRARALLAVLALALAVAGCEAKEEAPAPSEQGAQEPAGEPVATVEVSETDFALDPADPTVPEPGVVEFVATNDGQAPHSIEVEGPDQEFVSDTIQTGESTTLRAELPPGEYAWYCPIANHRELGMDGTVTVEEGSGSSGGSEEGSSAGGGSSDGGAAEEPSGGGSPGY
jgi:plastocyanin